MVELSYRELQKLCEQLQLPICCNSKKHVLMQHVNKTKKNIPKRKDSMTRQIEEISKQTGLVPISIIGEPGREATSIVFKDNKTGEEWVAKIFHKERKSVEKQIKFYQMAAAKNISPEIYPGLESNKQMLVSKKMDEVLLKREGHTNISPDSFWLKLSNIEKKNAVLRLFEKYLQLERLGIHHNDSNNLNIMWSYELQDWYIIDYGSSKKITKATLKKYTHPNIETGFNMIFATNKPAKNTIAWEIIEYLKEKGEIKTDPVYGRTRDQYPDIGTLSNEDKKFIDKITQNIR